MGKYEWSIIWADLMKGIYTHFKVKLKKQNTTVWLTLAYSVCVNQKLSTDE